MNVGSRVRTPTGTGTLKRFVIDERWSFGRPDVIRWAGVQLDDKDFVQLFHPAHVQEVTMNEDTTTGGLLIQTPVDEAVPAPEPDDPEEPDPTPEPEPDDAEADEKLEELIEFPE